MHYDCGADYTGMIAHVGGAEEEERVYSGTRCLVCGCVQLEQCICLFTLSDSQPIY